MTWPRLANSLDSAQASTAKAIGTMVRAISGDRRLVMIRYMKVMTMAKPRKVSMGIPLDFREEKKGFSRGGRAQ